MTTTTGGSQKSSATPLASAGPSTSTDPPGNSVSSTSAVSALTAPSTTDIDFSPSTGTTAVRADPPQRLHPIPLSSDAGKTLDWTGVGHGYGSEDEKGERSDKNEKRWSLSVSRKGKEKDKEKEKEKERELMPTLEDLKRQEGIHVAKLSRIKALSTQPTNKKVAIIANQLGRQYNLIYSSLPTNMQEFNLLKVSRWYGEQDDIVRSSLEKAEPFIWLKHLEKRNDGGEGAEASKEGNKDDVTAFTPRLPWHLSALIMEEFIHAQNAKTRSHIPHHLPPRLQDNAKPTNSGHYTDRLMGSIPEDPSGSDMPNDTDIGVPDGEGRISFEPLLDPPSLGTRPSNESRRSLESTFSSIFSSVGGAGTNPNSASTAVGGGGGTTNTNSNTATAGIGFSSPTSSRSRLHIRDNFGLRKPRRAPRDENHSDDANDGNVSSTRNSESDGGAGVNMKGAREIDGSFVRVDESELSTARPEPSPVAGLMSPAGGDARALASGGSNTGSGPGSNTGLTNAPQTTNRNLRPLRSLRNRKSLPPSEEDRIALAIARKRKEDAEEAREDMEYEMKAQLIASCKDSNTHIRSVLNHIAQHMREYEMCQTSAGGDSGYEYTTLPHELLEAFSHDPANVTSSTKRLKSYRAVDDIYHRLTRQRAVFREFLDRNTNNGDADDSDGETIPAPVTQDILKNPIDSLMSTLKKLEEHRLGIVHREKDVSEMLRDTQVIHSEVKKRYNSTLAHTSVVYPELSQIVALEESYKDQYQHLWDIGMDALTFILDSVTPFWRTYGKLIGDDVQDFLIIPLYRNEFTGESKRYPILHVPRRSFRHWVGLFVFFLVSVGVMVLQGRTAVVCVLNYRLLGWLEHGGLRWFRWCVMIPSFWMGILVQWMAVIGEAAVVIMQLGTVLWWIGWSIRVLN
ncbi:hypothetical protein J3R30DRAFT_3281609 [Lentinula aciculospora]|uniref:Uncharacterized protein n=1 Tax=Lentinula aciculospora TaxID=153920 RepID=A0A9W9ANH3_9AGAR|nr:hypothetical protein J3R30DRAFT_3281609 [Lentinula aciculospora]